MPTEKEYYLVGAQNRQERIKIELLNYQYQVVDTIQGNVVGQPSFNISSSSDIRRTCSFVIVPTDSSFDIEYGSKIWLDKFVKVYKGIKVNPLYEEYEWTKMGIYMINNPNQSYNLSENKITISGIDLIARLNGTRGSQLTTATYLIPEGTVIRDAIIAILEENDITNYMIDDIIIYEDNEESNKTPYEIKKEVGGTPLDLLKQLLEIVPNYQMYFDVDGVFHVNKIPTGENEQIVADKNIFNKVMIGYSRNTDYTLVKNSVQVFGKTHDIDNYGEATYNSTNNTYSTEISSLVSLMNYTMVGFTADKNSLKNPYISINNFGSKQIVNENGNDVYLLKDEYYVIKYNEDLGKFIFLGGIQPMAEYKETNPSSPFYIYGTMGEIKKVFTGGEYDNISSDSLAYERAKYELYVNCRLQDNITITCVPIYWLDVNNLVEITLPNKQGKSYTDTYLVKEISISDNQSITLMKYYPSYV